MHKALALTIRTVYLAFLIADAVMGNWTGVLFNSAAFIAALPLLWMARKDERYYLADALAVGLFLLTRGVEPLGIVLEASILGWDKLFHALGGAVVAYPAWIWFKGRTDPWAAGIATVAVAISVGAWWEVFELAYFWLFRADLINSLTYIDTVLDLVAVTVGAKMLVWILLWKSKNDPQGPLASRSR